MADENVIGVKAILDMSEWTPSQKQLEDGLAHVNKVIEDSTRKQADNARRVADATQKAADEQEKANKRISDSAKRAADEQEKSHKKVAQALRNFSIAFVITTAAIVKGYEAIKQEAMRIGDKETIERFEKTDKALRDFRDTVDSVAFAALPIKESLDGITAGFNALSQVVTLASAGMVKVAVLGLGVLKFVQDFKLGIVSIKDIGARR